MTTTTAARPRVLRPALLIGVLVLAVIIALLAAVVGPRYVWNPRIDSLHAIDTSTGQQIKPSSDGIARLGRGHVISLAGTTTNADTARIVLRPDGSTTRLAVLPAVPVTGGRITADVPQVAKLPAGSYTIGVYLNGNNTIDGSVDLVIR